MSSSSRSGSGSGSRQRRQRSGEPQDEYPSLPAPRLPPLRALAAQRERDNASPAASPTASSRAQTRFWSDVASRRAERIRSLDADQLALNEFQRVLDQAWGPSPPVPARPDHRPDRPDRSRGPDARPGNLDDLDRSLDEANSHLRALLEMTNHASLSGPLPRSGDSPPPHHLHLHPHHHQQHQQLHLHQLHQLHQLHHPPDLADTARRSKRRKIESDRLASRPPPFRYGKYGQVEPGQLRMEIVSCDGGMFSNESSYAAENILKNDGSVYCTKGNRCNIVLRHQGATPFTLQELIIKGPTSMNYSHPIREGMAFVTMDDNVVLSRTAQYQIQYGPAGRDSSRSRGDGRDTPRRALSVRQGDAGGASTRVRRATLYRGDDDDYRIAQMPPEFTAGQPNVGVSTECSDEDQGDGGAAATADGADARRFRRPPNRIGLLPFENMDSDSDSDDDDDDDDYNFDDVSFGFDAGRPTGTGTGTGASTDPATLSLSEAWDAHASATQDAVRAVGGELLAPHARFLIEKRKSTCTIRFDPPVTGRFILLKMWNSHHDPSCNIDIQSVMAKGFAGPRFFPSVEMR